MSHKCDWPQKDCGICNGFRSTPDQLERAQAWLDRARAWMTAHPDADCYPCRRTPCVCSDCERQQALPGVSP